jgi:hypothetical protein
MILTFCGHYGGEESHLLHIVSLSIKLNQVTNVARADDVGCVKVIQQVLKELLVDKGQCQNHRSKGNRQFLQLELENENEDYCD